MRIKVTPEALGDLLRAHPRITSASLLRGAQVEAQRVVAKAKKESVVVDGHFRAAWGVEVRPDMVRVKNDAPYAGIIERGARPHAVSPEGVEAIRQWVIKKGLVKTLKGPGRGRQGPAQLAPITRKQALSGAFDAEIEEIVHAVVWKLKTKGQQGNFMLERLAKESVGRLQSEVERQLQIMLEKESHK